jgi:ATP-dependent Lon protease
VSSKADQDNDIQALAKLKEIYEADKSNKSIENCMKMLEENVKLRKEKEDKKQRKYKDKNLRIFKKILKDKNVNDDFSFYDDLDVVKQNKIIKELREINKITRIERPYRMTLLESDIPVKYKGAAMKKINALRYMEPGSGDYYKLKTWVDTFMKIPFNKYSSFPITIDDGIEKCHEFMAEAQKTLDDAVYGLNDAKMQVMQLFGQLLANPKAVGTAIGIHGPPGTGKTSLIKDGISKILKRPFAFITLGGAQDGSFLDGHGVTYEGSVWGRIAQAAIDAQSMDVVFLFDEVDKISDTARGEEINGILTHLIDTTQNDKFHDKYFAEVEFDLSRCLFIFSYNDEKKVNPILLDRMYRIQTKGYVPKEKIVIANDYLLPKIREQVKFKAGEIVIPDDTLNYIIDNYCEKEEGVRNMKRCLEIIHTKMNLYRLMRPGSNLFGDQMTLKVEFPFTVTKDIADKMIKKGDLAGKSSFNSMFI